MQCKWHQSSFLLHQLLIIPLYSNGINRVGKNLIRFDEVEWIYVIKSRTNWPVQRYNCIGKLFIEIGVQKFYHAEIISCHSEPNFFQLMQLQNRVFQFNEGIEWTRGIQFLLFNLIRFRFTSELFYNITCCNYLLLMFSRWIFLHSQMNFSNLCSPCFKFSNIFLGFLRYEKYKLFFLVKWQRFREIKK